VFNKWCPRKQSLHLQSLTACSRKWMWLIGRIKVCSLIKWGYRRGTRKKAIGRHKRIFTTTTESRLIFTCSLQLRRMRLIWCYRKATCRCSRNIWVRVHIGRTKLRSLEGTLQIRSTRSSLRLDWPRSWTRWIGRRHRSLDCLKEKWLLRLRIVRRV